MTQRTDSYTLLTLWVGSCKRWKAWQADDWRFPQ